MSSIPPKSARTVACPACGKATLFAPANPWRPFCSDRCRLSDLGGWAAEEYRIPAKPDEEQGADPESSG
ncbi:MAG TPA: DNA gyrase inhibitor YacG [Usitatibacter sp.]|nr:DNA gyrase inhibitor YacG [Usitatibacter sp.]